MKTKRFKIAGLIALSLILMVTIAACDTADTTEDVEDVTVVSLETVEDVEVPFNTAEEDVIADHLPAEVEATLSDDSTEDLDVAWSSEDYTADEAGDYTFVGAVEYDGEVTDTNDVTVTVMEDPDDDDNDEPVDEDANQPLLRVMDNDVFAGDTAYTLADEGARDIDVRFNNKTSGTLDAHKVKVEIFDANGDLVPGEKYEWTEESLREGKSTIGETITPVLSSGEYTMAIDVWADEGGNPDWSSEVDLYVGKVGVENPDVFKTFSSVNDALEYCNTVTLFEDVAEDVVIENADVTLDLNGFAVNDVTIGEDAADPEIMGSVIDGDLTIMWDGVVKVADSVDITGNIIFEEVAWNNAKIEGNPSHAGFKYNSVSVSDGGELDNALMNEAEQIFFSDDI